MTVVKLELGRPIPIMNEGYTSATYCRVPIAVDDPRSSEPLVPIIDFGVAGQCYYTRTDGRNKPYNRPLEGALDRILCRLSVAEKLRDVNEILHPSGLELFVFDGYRPVACQQALWDFFMDELGAEHPEASEDELREKVLEFVSDPTSFNEHDPSTWPTHVTGGAVDLTLRESAGGRELDMGTHFDDPRPISHTDYFERLLHKGEIEPDDRRLLNRRALYNAMIAVGFVNYPAEFWHFDWGSQLYVFVLSCHTDNGPTEAWYGYVEKGEG